MSEKIPNQLRVKLSDVRLAFPTIWDPEQFQGTGEAAYSCSLIVPRDSPQLKQIEAAIILAATRKWPEKWANILREIKNKDALCVHDGDMKSEWEGFADNWYVSCRGTTRPKIVDINPDKELTRNSGKPYAGCYVTAVIEIWAQSNQYGKRINASLAGLQFKRDGEAFAGGRPADTSEFDMAEGADAEFNSGSDSLFGE